MRKAVGLGAWGVHGTLGPPRAVCSIAVLQVGFAVPEGGLHTAAGVADCGMGSVEEGVAEAGWQVTVVF